MNKLLDRYAVVFVAIAATLWASDAYFRNQLVQHLSATQIVVAEDALVTLFLLPVLIRSRHELKLLGARGWTADAGRETCRRRFAIGGRGRRCAWRDLFDFPKTAACVC